MRKSYEKIWQNICKQTRNEKNLEEIWNLVRDNDCEEFERKWKMF